MLVEIEEFQKFAPAGCLKYQNKGKKNPKYGGVDSHLPFADLPQHRHHGNNRAENERCPELYRHCNHRFPPLPASAGIADHQDGDQHARHIPG